ncbi:MAG TPA: cytochrome c [Candidatus Elarobacter sp.]|nr:cytochrome c [Dongiaceae bacterium]HZW52850.1 cytochrome c [Candidatus Elarobacter sp.]
MRRFLGGFVAALVVLLLVVFGAVKTGMVPARADGPLLPGERWASHTALKAAIAREAPKPPYPFTPTDADVEQGAKLYVQNCAVCHGTAHSTPDAIARGLGVRPPQFNKNDVMDDEEGETYWKIEHGIRFTGMPSYAHSLDEKSIWQLTYFMKRVPDHLPAAAKSIWEKPSQVPPPTPMPALPVKPGQGSSGPP